MGFLVRFCKHYGILRPLLMCKHTQAGVELFAIIRMRNIDTHRGFSWGTSMLPFYNDGSHMQKINIYSTSFLEPKIGCVVYLWFNITRNVWRREMDVIRQCTSYCSTTFSALLYLFTAIPNTFHSKSCHCNNRHMSEAKTEQLLCSTKKNINV